LGVKLLVRKKIVLLGDSAVGKTSLIRRYVFDSFDDSYIATIGSKVTMKELKLKTQGQFFKLQLMIWDIIGREGYYGLHAKTFVGVHGAIVVAELTRKETLHSLERFWVPFLLKVVGNVPLIFVCNKLDLKDELQFGIDDLRDVALRYYGDFKGILPKKLKVYYSTSAKTGRSVETAFESLGYLVLSKKALKDPVKKIYQRLTALGLRRRSELITPVGALDAIILDFCECFEDSRLAMLILRQELTRAAFDINNPTKEGVIRAVEYLAEAELEFMEEEDVSANLERRKKLADKIVE
jgi:small GTP-binding protein